MRKGKWSVLHLAADYTKYPDVIKALVDAGADLEARGGRDNLTPLHQAVEWGYPGAVKGFIDAGADLEARDKRGWTPLHLAIFGMRPKEVIPILLAAGANPNAEDYEGRRPIDLTKRNKKKRMLAAAGGTPSPRKKKSSGSGLGALVAGVAVGTALGAAGASDEEALAAGTVFAEQVQTGQTSSGGTGTAGAVGGVTSVGGACEIPGYPRPPGGVANVGLPWCPANVGFQVRAFALQAAGAQCALATGSSSTPEQIQVRRGEIAAACGRLAALGASNCRCPAGLGGSGYSEDYGAIERENQRREQQAKQQEEARLAAQRARQARQAEEARQEAARRQIEINRRNARILSGNCSCIRIQDDGEYTCMDGFVVGNNSSGKPLCDIRR